MKERTWLSILLSYAGPCRGKMAASVALAVVSVAGGFVPYLGVYQILRLFVERRAGLEGILLWCGVCLAGYAVKVAGYALSTMLAHVSAYTILEGLRLQVADQLMRAPGRGGIPAHRGHEEHHRGPHRGCGAAPGPHDPRAEL